MTRKYHRAFSRSATSSRTNSLSGSRLEEKGRLLSLPTTIWRSSSPSAKERIGLTPCFTIHEILSCKDKIFSWGNHVSFSLRSWSIRTKLFLVFGVLALLIVSAVGGG